MGTMRNPYINPKTTQKLFFSPTAEVSRLERTQKANQKVVLSFYGHKIDMPFKLFSSIKNVRMTTNLADMRGAAHQTIEAYRVVIEHPLGTTFFRLDIPKEIPASQMTADAFTLAELNMQSKREFEDYVINRRQYDLEFSAMDLSHRQARLARKYEYVNKGIDLVLGTLSFGVSGFTAGNTIGNWIKSLRESQKKNLAEFNSYPAIPTSPHDLLTLRGGPALVPSSLIPNWNFYQPTLKKARVPFKGQQMMLVSGLGAYKGASGIASGISGLVSASERARLQEEGFGIEIQNKALRSYNIDLGFERDRENYLFNMRRIFSGESYNDVTNRQRQKALDEYESPVVKDIYLELWTTSGEQDRYVKDYHDKFGVDCRVANKVINFKDRMDLGIYCLEDVVIENLADRVEFEFLKTRLTGGIRFIKWVEGDNIKELTIVDKKILELEGEVSKCKRESLEYRTKAEQQISELSETKNTLTHQLDEKVNEYHELSQRYREKEAELSTQTNLAVLYKNEADHFKADLLKSDQAHAQEKEGHSGTKKELEDKKQEVITLTQQVDTQIKTIEEEKKNVANAKRELQESKEKNQELERQKQQLTQEKEESARQLQQCRSQVETKDAQLRQKNAQIKQDQAQLAQKNQEIQQKTKQLADQKKDRDWWYSEGQKKRTAERERDEARRQKTQLETEKQALQAEIDRLKKEGDKSQLENKVKELEASLAGVREIEQQLRKELANSWSPITVGSAWEKLKCGQEIYVIFKDLNWEFDKVNLYQWDNDYCLFYLSRTQQTFKIWKWWGKGAGWGAGYDLQFFYKFDNDEFKSTQLKHYYQANYQTDEQSKWASQSQTAKRKQFSNAVYVGNWIILDQCDNPQALHIPRIKNKIGSSGMTLETLTLEKPVYWDEDKRIWSAFPIKDKPQVKKINLYKEYLDFLGLRWSKKQKKAVPKNISEEDLDFGEPDAPDEMGVGIRDMK